jgi:type I restriction enzyme, S subunit
MREIWQTKALGELCEIDLGKTPARANASYWDEKCDSGNVWLSIADLLNAEDNIVFDSKEYISDIGAAICKLVRKGTLLVSFKLTLGRLAFAGRDLFTNEAIAALTISNEHEISKEFLFYYLTFFDWVKAAENDMKLKGMTLNKAKLKVMPVSFPPLPEQQRIVALLDEAFAGLATVKANAERNLQNARAIFESHLQSVFSQRGEGWRTTTLGAVIDLLAGFAFKSAQYTNDDDGIRLLRGDNIIQGCLRWDDVKRWPADNATDYDRYQLEEGDVVLAMDRPWVKAGLKHATISADDLPCLLVQRTARLRGGADLHNRFLKLLIGSSAFTGHILGVQTGIGVPHISGQQIKDFVFAYPPLPEQQRIAEKLESLRAETQHLTRLYERKLAALEELKKTLLHQAFNGEL